MKRIILIGICLLNFGCQDEHKTSKTYYPDVLLVQTKDPNGNLNWVCMAVFRRRVCRECTTRRP